MREALRKGPAKVQTSRSKTFPAPRRGWISNENLASSKPEGAKVLDNFFPTATGVRVRRGSETYATIGNGDPVGAIMPYISGAANKLFAANANAIYDITTVVDPLVSPAASVSSLNGDEWAFAQFSNPAGVFLNAVNGVDVRQIFDGTSWSTSPTITAAGAAPFSDVWVFKNRLFFIERNTMDAWYLPVDAIGGTAVEFPLGGVFRLGGTLLFGSTWSYDAGSGLTESCIFVTTEGEVAIYEGSNPASASDWALKGVYRIGRPLGKRAWFKAGGDIAIATDIGLVPLSQAIRMDPAALAAKAISYPIEPDWNAEAAQRRAQYSWSVEMWPTQQMAIIAMPAYASLPEICFVVNVRTGAWARYTGWNTQCLGLYIDRMFFGTREGAIKEAEIGGSDDGEIYTATYVGLFDNLGAPANTKDVSIGRATFLTTIDTNSKISVSTDYVVQLPTAPNVAASPYGPNNWNQGLWNSAVWSSAPVPEREAEWRSVSGVGYSIAPNVQVSIGGLIEPDISLVQVDLMYELGAPVT